MNARAPRDRFLPPTAILALLALLASATLLQACSSGPADSDAKPARGAGPATPTTPPATAKMEGADKAFFVTLPSGDKVTVGVFPNTDWAGRKLLFDPPVAKLDANVLPLAQNSMWEVYGRQRGHFKPADMRVAMREKLGSILTFKLSSGGLLCVFPLQDDDRPMMKGMFLWVE